MKKFFMYLVAFIGGLIIGTIFVVNGFNVLTWQYWLICLPLSFLYGWLIGKLFLR
jgi:hypothetical protein